MNPRMQISVERLQAGSTYGNALQFARENVGDFYLVDAKGNEHRPVGVSEGPDGSLYVADDRGGRIWRIIFTGGRDE